MADRVKEAGEACFDAHASDCSGFVRAVASQLGVQLHGLANEIVDTIRDGDDWTPCPMGLRLPRPRPLGSSSSADREDRSRPGRISTAMLSS
jgi:hypothetical protein